MHASDTPPWTPRDVVVALVAFALTLGLLAGGHGSTRGIDAPSVALAALACLPLVAHRRAPLGVFALTTAASAAINGFGYPAGPPFGPTVALFYVANDDRTRSRVGRTAAVVLGMFAVHLGATAISEGGFPATPILFGVVVWGAAWASATGCAGAAGAGPTWPSGPPGPSTTPPASAGSPRPRSAPASPATCTTRRPTRST